MIVADATEEIVADATEETVTAADAAEIAKGEITKAIEEISKDVTAKEN